MDGLSVSSLSLSLSLSLSGLKQEAMLVAYMANHWGHCLGF